MIEMERDDLIVLMESGYIYLGMGRFHEAQEVFEGVSVLVPDNEVPVVALGSVYFAQGKFDQAIRLYKKALTIKKDSSFAHSYLGESLFFKGKKKEAVSSLKEAIRLDPSGKSGAFAQALLGAIEKGLEPGPLKVQKAG